MYIFDRLNSYLHLLKNFYFNKSHFQGPESIDLAITSVCNHKCYFCDEHSYFIDDREKIKSQTLDELTLDALFSDLVKLKVKKITLGGNGEQLIIPITSKYILKYGHIFKFQVSSNGTTLNKINEEMLSKIDRFSISINSFVDATHQKIHGYNLNTSNSQLPKIIENTERILKLKKAKEKIQISIAISNDNVNELGLIFSYMHKWNCKFSIRPIHIIFDEMNDKNVGLSIEQINLVIDYCNSYLLSNRDNLSSLIISNINDMVSSFSEYKNMISVSKNQKPCFTGFRLINIWSNGDVSQCTYSHFNLGNIRKNNFEYIWKSNLMKSKIAEAALMDKNIDAPYLYCISCPEPEGRSSKIKKILDKIPYSNTLLYRNHIKNTSLLTNKRIIKIHSN